jgi:alkanesulfonate monooxygenase SsuD/methylene tetrahydromethanopterin reductase-like flavin-dependent oxidoreductase (luciferase family)
MRIGIYQDLRDSPPLTRGWAASAGAALERSEEAERIGLGAVWCSEHHFFEDGYLPQVLTWCAAVAARTKRIRIGTAILIAPLHSPLEIAEQAALVDQISEGRLELGLGAGYVDREFRAFGVDVGQRFELLESHIQEIRRLYAEGVVTPAPYQEDLPIWVGGFGPRGARIAGRNRARLMWLDAGLLEPYRRGLAEGGHDPEDAVVGGLATLILSRDPERAWAMLEPHLQYQWASYTSAALATGTDDHGLIMFDEGGTAIERSPGPAMFPPGYDAVTPEEALRRLRLWLADLPVSDLFFWDSIAGMPDELVEEHMSLLGELAPHLADLGLGAPLEPELQG